ncbi:hypothetical protein [Streptomyces fructofermentans]|uniref:hypothetical protein n=1 Tax=Streptomyces fructofermentans TaxID=152141 RepID=UPI0033EEEEFD
MTRWFRSHWAEAETWFYFEVEENGDLSRHVELHGPLEQPVAAASLVEWRATQRSGSLRGYESAFGAIAEVFVRPSNAGAAEPLTADAFESVWRSARAAREAHARMHRVR